MLRVLAAAAFAALPILSAFAPCAVEAGDSATISNDLTTVRVHLDSGRTSAFEVIDTASKRAVARIELGGGARWTAACAATSHGKGGTVALTNFDTGGAGGASAFDKESGLWLTLGESDRFPLLRFRFSPVPDDSAAAKMAIGSPKTLVMLACRMDSAQVLYRGGFQMPLPLIDPFPSQSDAMQGDWGSGWTFATPMKACPIPAVGLWNPSAATFIAFESQEARSGDKSDKDIVFAYGSPESEGDKTSARPRPFLAAAIPLNSVNSRLRIIYSIGMPSHRSPNEFVLNHIFETYGQYLPAPSAVNDLGWLPQREDFVPDDARTGALLWRVPKQSIAARDWLFAEDTLVPSGEYRGVLNTECAPIRPATARGMHQVPGTRPPDGLADASQALMARARHYGSSDSLRKDWMVLKEACIQKTIADDDCRFWRFPLRGDYKDMFGGKSAATTHCSSTWQTGADLLAMYAATQDPELLPYIDGVFRWGRHCVFTRGGYGVEPAVVSAPLAYEISVEFYLNFHHVFKRHQDAARRAMAEEALSLGRSLLYRHLAVYTDDPDEADNLDPSFLIQGTSAPTSFGTVSWDGTERLILAMALYYLETSDPVLRYYVQGALQRWPIGYEADVRHTIEFLGVSHAGPRPRGLRQGRIVPGDSLARYFQPIGRAAVRVLYGAGGALAFSRGAALDIQNFAADSDGDCSFALSGRLGSSSTIIITAPLRTLHGKKVFVNGKEVVPRIIGRHGENLVLDDIRAGDTITLGEIGTPSRAEKGLPAAGAARAFSTRLDNFEMLPLTGGEALDTSWQNGLSWSGYSDGLSYAWGVPFRLMPPANGGVPLCKQPVSLPIRKPIGSAFIFASVAKGPIAAVMVYTDGILERHELAGGQVAVASPPMRRWQILIYPVRPKRPDTVVERLEVTGEGNLFAVTTHSSWPPVVEAALGAQAARAAGVAAEIEATKRRLAMQEQMIPHLRGKVARAVRGKEVRVGFIPPHESYTETLKTACALLGAPPVMLTPNDVIDPNAFNAQRYPIVVYSAPETYLHTVKQPGDAAQAVKRYLAGGGCLVSAAYGVPFYYAMRLEGDKYVRVPGTRHGETCSELEMFIAHASVPPPEQMPRFELLPGQRIFTHIPNQFKYDRRAGGPYRPLDPKGTPAEDVFKPVMVLKDGAGGEHGVIAADIEHKCKRYKGGRVIFLWGNILNTERHLPIALDLMSYALSTAKFSQRPVTARSAAILPLDMAGHDKAIAEALGAVGLKPILLSPEDFADPAVFNPVNFPIAVHAVGQEYYFSEAAGRTNLAQTYLDYVRGGGFLVACGNMFQFYYARAPGARAPGARTPAPKGGWQQRPDPDRLIPSALGLEVCNSRFTDRRPIFLRCLPGQEIIAFKSPMRLQFSDMGRYRAVVASEMPARDFVPIADVCDERGVSLGGHVIALIRFKALESRGNEVLWFWGDLLDDTSTYPLLQQTVKYAYGRRAKELSNESAP